MHIDCETCVVRGGACADCVVSVLLGVPDFESVAAPGRPRPVGVPRLSLLRRTEHWVGEQADGTPLPDDLDADTERALGLLAAAGLVPGLALAPEVRRAG